jgi:hypothetical protein
LFDEEYKKEYREKRSNRARLWQSIRGGAFTGKIHSEETKDKQRSAMIGKMNGRKNPSYGKHWITNGTENKLVKKESVPIGWRKGRV